MAITDSIKRFIKLALAAVVIALIAFGAGWYAKPKEVKTVTKTDIVTKMVTVRDEEYTQQRIEQYKQTHRDEFTVVKHQTKKVLVPCADTPAPEGMCKPPCATDCSQCPKQVIEETTDTTEHHDQTTDTQVSTQTDTQGSSHTESQTDTKIHTETTTTFADGSVGDWSLSLRGAVSVFDTKLKLDPIYGVEVGRKLFGPLYIAGSIYTDKRAELTAQLLTKDWDIEVGVGSKYDALKPYYAGSVDRRLLGPLWVGAWGNSEPMLGVRLSFLVK